MNLDLLQKNLTTTWLGKKIHFRDQVDSTNLWAASAIKEGSQRGEVFLTDDQTKGRGREKRVWESQRGKDILVSLIDSVPSDSSKVYQLALVAGVGFIYGLLDYCPNLNFKLKWPNDLYLNSKKLGGILCEGHPPFVIIGVGMNINSIGSNFSSDISSCAISLRDSIQKNYQRELLLTSCLNQYEKWRQIYEAKGIEPIISEWNQHSLLANKRLKIVDSTGSYQGTYKGLDKDGFLEVDCGDGIRTLYAGDVFLSS